MNQEAIDAALQEANERLIKQDRLHGVEDPEPQYTLGSNVCIQCDYGLGLETSPMMRHIKRMAGHPIKRVCYKEPTPTPYNPNLAPSSPKLDL